MCKALSRQPSSTDRALVSLFVDNLPEDTSQSWLKKLFNKYGVVKEVFIPAKRSKATGRRFAFVRYDCDISADVAIANAHGMWIEECKLFVKRASFGQGEKAEPHNHKMQFHRDHMKTYSHLLDSSSTGKTTKEDQLNLSMLHGKSYANAVKGVIEAKGLVKENIITLRMQAEETDWLSTSAVAKSHLDVAVDDLATNINLELKLNIQVRSLGGRNFLLTFPTSVDRNKMVQDKIFGKWFSFLQPWTGEAAGVERFAWLSCFGVPLNAWGLNLFKSIGNIWGSFIRTDANTSKLFSFDKGRILIATEAKSKIDSWINVDIKGVCYPIKVIEEDYFISKILNEDGLSDSSSGDETDKKDADMDIPIEKTTNVVENMLEVGNANFIAAMTSQSRIAVDVSSNSCIGEGFLARDDGNKVVNIAGPLTDNLVGIVDESLAASEAIEEEGREDGEIDGSNNVEDVEGDIRVNESPYSVPDSVGSKTEDSISNFDTMEDVDEVADTEVGANVEDVEEVDDTVDGALKGIKEKRTKKSINDILGYARVNTGDNKGKRNKKKSVVLRAAVASAALSASISSGNINNRNRILLDEAQAIWAVDKLFGISYDGEENEVISKIAEMEALNKERAVNNH